MKKIILFVLLVALSLYRCGKNDDLPEDTGSPSDVERIISELNIKPSNSKDITYIGLAVDSTEYKIVGGKMNNNAWVAKYDKNGNEIFSYQCTDIFDQNLKYSHFNGFSPKIINNNFLVLVIWFTDNDAPDSTTANTGSLLCVIDSDSGDEIHRFSFCKNDVYDVIKTPFSYFIEASRNSVTAGAGLVADYFSVSLDGKEFWERKLSDTEKKGLKEYQYCAFFDSQDIVYLNSTERILYPNEDNEYNAIYSYKFKSINIKNYKLNYEFDVLLVGYNFYKSKITYEFDSISIVSNIIKIEYSEYHYEKIVDDSITEASHIEYTLLNKYYYEIDVKTGSIIANGKY